MKSDWKMLLTGFCLGFTAYLFLMKPQPQKEEEFSVAKYWQAVGKYLTKALVNEQNKQA